MRHESITETRLTKDDRRRIRAAIGLNLFFGAAFIIIMILIVLLIGAGVISFLSQPAPGFTERLLVFLACAFFLYLLIAAKWLVKILDLAAGKKICFRTRDFQLKKEKHDLILRIKSPVSVKTDVYEQLIDFVNLEESIDVELSKWTKTLLCVSQENENLLRKIEIEFD